MIIRGDTNIIKIYDYSYLINLDDYDLDDSKEIERLKENVAAYLDSGEAEALSLNEDLTGINPEGIEIEIENKIFTAEDIDYINKDIDKIINENFKTGDIILLLKTNGDGYFEYEKNPDINEIKIGYSACDIKKPDNEIYNKFCDLLLPNNVEMNGEKQDVVASNFYPKSEMTAELYTIMNDNGKYLDKITEIDVMHFGWDLLEDIIQIDYDKSI
ncbi:MULTISPECIES: hypothetical protein [unclassified Lebetimonas]|uniref:hypothetical protein n=1 Tax=unclassified Lebetimonas TaxID=2648158 RepID=UPI000465E13C|nr:MULTISPECIES: hypothetical protein [unclassified Lebetimonas]